MTYSLLAKNVIRAVVCAVFVLALGSCINHLADNTGTLTINLGGSAGGSRAVQEWPPKDDRLKDIKYSITLSGKSGAIRLDAEGGDIIKTTLAAGIWNITITAFLDGEPYAKGSAVAEVKAGQTVYVPIALRYAGGGESEETFTVTFDFNDGRPVDEQTVDKGDTVTKPANPTRDGYVFTDWYSDSSLNTLYNFDTLVYGNIVLYAKWIQFITDTAKIVEYLAAQSGGVSITDPIYLLIQIDLGTMTQTTSGWRQLIDALETAGKYVNLDLSACTMTGTEFNPDYTVETGKNKIVEIALPDTAKSIADGPYATYSAFKNFTELKSFSGTGLTYIGKYAFYGTRLAMTSLPAGLTSIGEKAFENCTSLALTSLPAEVTIGDYAFSHCTNLALTSLPAEITIGNGVFYECTSLALTSLPEGFTSIGVQTFLGCTSLALTYLPAEITSIGLTAFYGCTRLDLTFLPEGITSIDSATFYGCTSLAQMTLPAGLTSIGAEAFYDCTSLAEVTCLATTPPTLGDDVFRNTSLSLQIKVPAASVSAYKVAAGWSEYAGRISGLPYKLGDTGPGGGKIFYYRETGFTMTDTNEICHYLEAAPDDMTTQLAWISSEYINTYIPDSETAIGTGRNNTAVILGTDVAAPAALACKDYRGPNNLTDWFLPSKDELNELYNNRTLLGNLVEEAGTYTSYWSSSAYHNDNGELAFSQDFFTGSQNVVYGRNYTFYVRAIRAF